MTLPQLPSPMEGMQQPWEALTHLVRLESQAYADCVDTAFKTTQPRLLNQTLQKEMKRLHNLQQTNRQIVRKAHDMAFSCSNSTRAAQRMLVLSASFLRIVNDTNTCSTQDRMILNSFLKQDESFQASESRQVASSAWDEYLQSTQETMMRITNYAHARSEYDYNYFIGIQARLKKLVAFQIPNIDVSLQELGVLDDLRKLLQSMVVALRDAQVRIEFLHGRLELFYTSISNLHLHYKDVFGRFQLASQFTRDFLPKGIALPDFFDMDNVPTPDLLLPVPFEVPTFALPLPDVDMLIAQYLNEAAALMARVIADLVDSVTDDIRIAFTDLLDELQDLLSLDDYHPPKYADSGKNIVNPEDEAKHLEELGQTLKEKGLAAFTRNWQIVDNQPIPELPTNSDHIPPTMERNQTTFEYLEPQFPIISFPAFIKGFVMFAFAHSGIVDMVLQFIRLKRLKDRHERNAQPDLPEIDYVDEEESDEKEEGGDEASPAVIQSKSNVLRLFVTPWMALGLILIPLAGMFLGLYLPHVYSNCVQTEKGTYLARFLIAPVQINNANLLGNSIYTSGAVRCANRQHRLGNRLYAQSDLVYRQDAANLQSAINQWSKPKENNGALRRCVDTTLMDEVVTSSCCGLDGYGGRCSFNQSKNLCPIDNSTLPAAAFRPLGEYLDNGACRQIMVIGLEDAYFDNSVLYEICDIVPCRGADSGLIHFFTIQAVCQIEVYIMGCCFWVLVAVYHMLMIGTACAQILSGVICVRWRSIRPDGIKLRTQVRENGELVKGFEQEERHSRVASAVRAYERVGWIRILLGSVLLLVWFISFFVLRHVLSKIVR
ncbi:hypothetical protein MPSEU_000634200 [Mayamaea pseudoterrestris]|nr:hypothetical protein MPSEU_000634200 [Mayamaea pseudoterrestris]